MHSIVHNGVQSISNNSADIEDDVILCTQTTSSSPLIVTNIDVYCIVCLQPLVHRLASSTPPMAANIDEYWKVYLQACVY